MSSQWFAASSLLKFYTILNFIFLSIILFVNWRAFLFVPLFYIPILIIYYNWKKNHRDVDLKLIVHTYILSNSLGVIIVLIVQAIVAIPIGIVCFGSKTFFELVQVVQELNPTSFKDMKDITVNKTFGFYLFMFLLAFLVAAGVEEMLKYQLVNRVTRMKCINYQTISGYHIYAITAALGFSIMENVGYQLVSGSKADTTILDLLFTAIQRLFIAIPVHGLCGYLIGLRVIRRDIFKQPLSLIDVIKWSVLIHGNFNFWLTMIAIHNDGTASTCLSVITLIIISVAVYYVVKREKKTVAELQDLVLNKMA